MLRPLMLTSLALAATTSVAHAQYAYSFTSGGPPVGDGSQYPRSLNPSRQVPGGAAATAFYGAAGMGFSNVNSNPAYFDANNLLTRPSTLINGEAFWTDPKLGNFRGSDGTPFSIAYMGLNLFSIDELEYGFDSDAGFGFDLAIAAVGGAISSGDGMSIDFQIQDALDRTARGTLHFGGSIGDESRAFEGTLVNQFQTLGSANGAFEGRFHLPIARLKQLIADQNGGETIDSKINFFDIDLAPFSTGGGTTQVAMDNVVYGNVTPIGPRAEPNYVPPAGPIGPNTPQYFGYAEAAPEDYDGDVRPVVLPPADLSTTKVTVISTTGNVPTADLGASAFTLGSNVAFEGVDEAEEPTLAAHEMTHVVQEGAGALPQTVSEGETPIGGSLGVNQVPKPQPRQLRRAEGVNAALAVTGITQGIELTTVLAASPTSPALQAAFAAAAAQAGDESQQIVSLAGDDFTRFTLTQDLLLSFDDVRPGAAAPTGTPSEPAAVDPNASFYFNYSLLQYVELKGESGEPMYLGDSGSIVSPYFDAAGNVLSYAVKTWLITDQSGVFVPVFINVPEPATIASLALLGAIAGRRRRTTSHR